MIHLLGLGRRNDELSGSCRTSDVGVIVNTLPKQSGECFGPFVAEVLMFEPVLAPVIGAVSVRRTTVRQHAGISTGVGRDRLRYRKLRIQNLQSSRKAVD